MLNVSVFYHVCNNLWYVSFSPDSLELEDQNNTFPYQRTYDDWGPNSALGQGMNRRSCLLYFCICVNIRHCLRHIHPHLKKQENVDSNNLIIKGNVLFIRS